MIGKALNENQTVLGIHLMGNEAKVDELGYVRPEKYHDIAMSHVITRLPCKIMNCYSFAHSRYFEDWNSPEPT